MKTKTFITGKLFGVGDRFRNTRHHLEFMLARYKNTVFLVDVRQGGNWHLGVELPYNTKLTIHELFTVFYTNETRLYEWKYLDNGTWMPMETQVPVYEKIVTFVYDKNQEHSFYQKENVSCRNVGVIEETDTYIFGTDLEKNAERRFLKNRIVEGSLREVSQNEQ